LEHESEGYGDYIYMNSFEFLAKARKYLADGNMELSLNACKAAISDATDAVELVFAGDFAFNELNDRKLAGEAYEKALQVTSNCFDIYYVLSSAGYIKMSDKEEVSVLIAKVEEECAAENDAWTMALLAQLVLEEIKDSVQSQRIFIKAKTLAIIHAPDFEKEFFRGALACFMETQRERQ